jgi:signal transduction histidine kinase
MAAGYALFWLVAGSFIEGRLNQYAGYIAAWYFIFGSIVVLGISGVGALWVTGIVIRHIARPLQRLKHAVAAVRDGDLGYDLPISGSDEFTELAAGFEQMRIRLKDSMQTREKSERDRRMMMASVTHDMKTPITSILGYAEGILDGVADTPEKVREYALIIEKKARSLQNLADDLSLLSRLENAKLPLDKKEEDLGELVSCVTAEFAHSEPGLSLRINISPGLIVCIDREKITRVLVNLFQNSVKYRNPDTAGPALSVILKRHSENAVLTVSDNGNGIAQADLLRVFDPFYRADASRGRQPGSGLGLSIARQLIELHGGKIWIVSNPDSGITVNITLPIV